MPIYAYQCVSCGNEFDLKQGFDADTVAPCPSCDNTARRRFVAPTVIYKGSGFYTTDYARKGAASANGSSSSNGEKPEKKSSEPKGEPAASKAESA